MTLEHLKEETILAYSKGPGLLPEAKRAIARAHINQCPQCLMRLDVYLKADFPFDDELDEVAGDEEENEHAPRSTARPSQTHVPFRAAASSHEPALEGDVHPRLF